MPGQSMGSITAEEAHERTGWPHWAASPPAPPTADALVAPPPPPPSPPPQKRPSMPGQSMGSITAEVAHERTGWPHWATVASKTPAEVRPVLPPSSPVSNDPGQAAQRAASLTFADYQSEMIVDENATLELVASVGRVAEALRRAKRGEAEILEELGDVLRAVAKLASQHGHNLDDVAANSLRLDRNRP